MGLGISHSRPDAAMARTVVEKGVIHAGYEPASSALKT